jgi:hypothetical protein
MSRNIAGMVGNDTIDPYPLIPREAAKVLCITHEAFARINREYHRFQNSIRKPALRKTAARQITKPEDAQKNQTRPINYEPTNAIYMNTCDYRRWCRVSEWFAQFTEFEGRSFDPIKMDT